MALLKKLSDQKLLSQLESLVERERAATLSIVLHLGEVERRKLYLKQAYTSMFDYCIEHLGYSPSAAGRRIQTVRCMRRHPEVLELLRRGDLNLSTVCRIAPVIEEQNKRELLGKVRRRSQREVEAVVAGYRPPVPLHDKVKPVRVIVPAPVELPTSRTEESHHSRSGSETGTAGPLSTDRTCESSHSRSGSRTESTDGIASAPAVPRIEQRLSVQFMVPRAFMKKYEEARALLSNKLGPSPGFEKVFEAALDAIIDKHSPAKRRERREKRKNAVNAKAPVSKRSSAASATGAVSKQSSAATKRAASKDGNGSARSASSKKGNGSSRSAALKRSTRTHQSASPERTRHIPAAVRDDVFARDNGRCAYHASNGKCCGSTLNLHVDHIVPFAKGGTHDPTNLRLLCANHNQLEAKRAFGDEHMKPYYRRE